MSALNQSGWKPEMAQSNSEAPATYTGNRALMLEEALIFEIGTNETTGVDLAPAPKVVPRLAGLARNRAIGLPGLSEPETVRHYTRLSVFFRSEAAR
jgi:glycine dehydrogenase subunit 2